MAASGVLCGITGTDNEEDEDMVEGSMALETLLMHRTISSTSINYKSLKIKESSAYLFTEKKEMF